MNKKVATLLKMIALALGLLAIGVIIYKKIGDGKNKVFTLYDFAMGTSVSLTLYGVDDEDPMGKDIIARINTLSNELISWRESTSQLYRLNNSYEPGIEYNISPELNEVIAMSYKICEDSKGALDITIRPLLNLWNIESATVDTFSIPDFMSICEMLPEIGYENVSLTDNGVTIGKEGVILDLGATGKGYALDVIRDEFLQDKVSGAVVTIGGSVLVYGCKNDGNPWNIGVRNPFGDDGDMMGYLKFEGDVNVCISTSGDYEKYIEFDGVRFHHIFDRETGYPAQSGLKSVTVVCENGLVSDGLSTACFVLGYDNSLELLKKYNAEAVFITGDGEVIVTDGLKDNFSEAE